jgi:hypothetical protein
MRRNLRLPFKETLIVIALLLLGGFMIHEGPEKDFDTPQVPLLGAAATNVCLNLTDLDELTKIAAKDLKAFVVKLEQKIKEGKCMKFPHPLAYLRTISKFRTADGESQRVVEFFWPEHPQERFYTFLPDSDLPPGLSKIAWTPGIFDQAGVLPDGTPKFFDITEAEKKWFEDSFVRSCCNIGDAFISDYFFEKDGRYYAEITDGYDHHPNVLKGIIPPGTIREIPPGVMAHMKAKKEDGSPAAPQNPTSHGIIFLHLYYNSTAQTMIGVGGKTNKPEDAEVLCYWPPAGN